MTTEQDKVMPTPGPWRVCGGGTPHYTGIAGPDNQLIVYAMADDQNEDQRDAGPMVSHDQQRANAHLIAAAPDLLACCKELREAVAACFRAMASSGDEMLTTRLELHLATAGIKNGFGVRAKEIIAKAEGRAQ